MKMWGIVLTILGLVVAIGAFLMGSTVAQDVPIDIGYSSITRTQQMHNLPRAQTQLLLFVGGCASFLGGLMLVAVGELTEALRRMVVGSASVDAVQGVTDPQPLAEVHPAPELSPEELEERRENIERKMAEARSLERKFVFGTVVFLGAIIALALMTMPRTSGQPATDIGSTNLEMQADNLEALAEQTSAEANALLETDRQ